ncbi:MAG: 23S rRNA (adenine(2503)-C(2))-methyltransferase RlmN [Planctomycetota bacterium]|nr:23S rRNA (adenine(2503)-C(2))-methyltransferase RlmN [Planctomycetota bacterium]
MSALPRITDLTHAQFRDLAEAHGVRPFRGDQAYEWVMKKGVRQPDDMSNLPKPFRDVLWEKLDCKDPVTKWSNDPQTTTDKLYMGLPDGDGVEAVLICDGRRTTVCLSSQVGCPVGCTFCASGLLGLRRNLSAGEILDQFIEARKRARSLDRRISNVVMMGMGEPLLNYDAVVHALEVLNDPEAGGIGARHITVSTVGLGKGVKRLAQEGKQYTLAFSLHAPDDETRSELIPFPGVLSIAELMDSAHEYLRDTGREVTFEYVLIEAVNASAKHAKHLADLLKGVRCTVNLIPYNENPGLPFRRPTPGSIDRFEAILRSRRIKVAVRKRKGHEILAACGQLRLRERRATSAE